MKRQPVRLVVLMSLFFMLTMLTPSFTASKAIILATTTSTQDSGLLDMLVPIFEAETGYIVKTIAVGSGQALALGQRGEADVLLTHAPDDEVKLENSGMVVNRRQVMFNDFVFVGPKIDPAGIKNAVTSIDALRRIAAVKATFVSRADDSGTHKKEQALWKDAMLTPQGKWYMESGVGMGQALSIAAEKDAYCFTDRGTYLALKKSLSSVILFEGDNELRNIYHVMQVNPQKFSKVNGVGAQAFADFMVSPAVQQIIKAFGADKFGQPLFFPLALRSGGGK